MNLSRRVGGLAACLFILSGVLSGSALALGRTRPDNPVLAGFSTGCTADAGLCWNGIVPGVTTPEEAYRLLREVGVRSGLGSLPQRARIFSHYLTSPGLPFLCALEIQVRNRIVVAIGLQYCPEVKLKVGEVAAVLGFPDRMFTRPRSLTYGVRAEQHYAWWSVFDPVGSVHLAAPSNMRRWRGFVPPWRYCQLEPGFKGC
jgi:hypothetical protein